MLFKNLATLRIDEPLLRKVETLRWRGVTPTFAAWTDRPAQDGDVIEIRQVFEMSDFPADVQAAAKS